MSSQSLADILEKNQEQFAAVTPYDLNKENVVIFDLTSKNEQLNQLDLNDEEAFTNYIFDRLKNNKVDVGIGKYDEDRQIYKRSEVFSGSKVRSIHLGIDIWAVNGTPVFAPLPGKVHSFKNNNAHADYGPTIILQHELEGIQFFTLYGHLSVQSLGDKTIGQEVGKGEQIATLGSYEENVHWPPHLHFQVIDNMDNHFGDYPGVAAKSDRYKYIKHCPDPNLILGIKALNKTVS
ncbi:peptidase M23 [Fulvivirga sp. RKSG066]|uniref:peptidoglycan DD-metalloendopeptidase family protein n=1 Tax=Fulvivirga aurantia TaxID=2529383 RepID=UPI0012BD59BB|nr:peptidoglycan DD-metalloendopeptidase family protein [Fulvivirga aurantia]MTI20850.1 peptidase M23 [Fulvivirga aurantia]